MIQKWDERYKGEEFAYGKEPNQFFKEWLQKFEPGTILMPADGEGRNGVYAAQQGWQVTSCDFSTEGRAKALQLAQEQGVALEYLVGDFEELQFAEASFDAIGLIYAHFAAEKKPAIHKLLHKSLKPGGTVIFEAFGKQHLQYKQQDPQVGGPDDINMLYSKEEITAAFGNYETLLLAEEEIQLHEGKYHNGKGSVIRFVGEKTAE